MAEPFNGMVDVLFGYDTDIHFENNDLMTTTGIDYIEREVYKLLITKSGDWKVDTRLGASPEKYIGEPNTREIGQELETFISQGLRDTVLPAQVHVRAIPVNYNNLIVVVELLTQGLQITTIPFEFDFVNGFRIVNRRDERVQKALSSTRHKVNDITNLKRPNKYWSRLRENTL